MTKNAPNKLSSSSRTATAVISSSRITVFSPQDIDTLLKPYAQYIPYLVRKQIPRNRILPGELIDEINDISQRTLIKFWLKLTSNQVQITSPKSYVGRIVFSQCMDVARLNKCKALRMPESQDEELFQEHILLFQSEGTGDPALVYERKELINEVLDYVVQLPPIQMKAMICMLKDEVSDAFPLAEAFAKRGIDIRYTCWPDDRCERQKLLSSLSAARKKLRALMPEYALA